MTKTDTQETWLPVSVLSWSAPVPIGILHLWGFIPLSQNGALELKGRIPFKAEYMRNAVNCLHRELLLHGEFYIKQKWLRVKINLENSILKTNLTSMNFLYNFSTTSTLDLFLFCLLHTGLNSWLLFKGFMWKIQYLYT